MDPKSPASSRMTRTWVVEGGDNEVWHADTVVIGLDAESPTRWSSASTPPLPMRRWYA